ncbi:hypothetical protein DFJ73DRAFT_847375, partial [Zopfochytrium polystomum]
MLPESPTTATTSILGDGATADAGGTTTETRADMVLDGLGVTTESNAVMTESEGSSGRSATSVCNAGSSGGATAASSMRSSEKGYALLLTPRRMCSISIRHGCGADSLPTHTSRRILTAILSLASCMQTTIFPPSSYNIEAALFCNCLAYAGLWDGAWGGGKANESMCWAKHNRPQNPKSKGEANFLLSFLFSLALAPFLLPWCVDDCVQRLALFYCDANYSSFFFFFFFFSQQRDDV